MKVGRFRAIRISLPAKHRTATKSVPFGEGQILLQVDDAGDVDQRLLWGAGVDQILADENGSGDVYWALTDVQNTIHDWVEYDAVADETSVVNHIAYNAYGKITSQTNSSLNALDLYYTARFFDEATGLQYNTNRWYDAELGRWLSQDPIGFAAGDENLYRYVGNSHLNAVDPSGLIIEPFLSQSYPRSYRFKKVVRENIDAIYKRFNVSMFTGNPAFQIGMPNSKMFSPVEVSPNLILGNMPEIEETPDKLCATLKRLPQLYVEVVTHSPFTSFDGVLDNHTNPPTYYPDEFRQEIEHRHFRMREVYRLGAKVFLDAVSDKGLVFQMAKKTIQRDNPGDARKVLEKYYLKNKNLAVAAFEKYILGELREIGFEKGIYVNDVHNGINVRRFAGFDQTTIWKTRIPTFKPFPISAITLP